MRKSLKIKSLVIFMAWMVIFTHSVIPHNHHHENTGGCYELIHNTTSYNPDADHHSKIEPLPEAIKICHFSDILFNQYNQEIPVISKHELDYFYPLSYSISIIDLQSDHYLTEPYFGSSQLRAPPCA